MNLYEQFSYVDGHYEHKAKKIRTRWVRMRAKDVRELVIDKAGGSNCFSTVQRFKDAVSMRDRDVKEEAERQKETPEQVIARMELEPHLYGEKQIHYHGLYFDFDADPDPNKKHNPFIGKTEEECFHLALNDVRAVAKYLRDKFYLNDAHVQVWYSGKKGFHLMVRPELFDMKPHHNLSYMVAFAALDLIHELGLVTMDKSVYSIPRMWRIANTVHHSTGRYKVELRMNELLTMTRAEIIDAARQPRKEFDTDYIVTGTPTSHLWPEDNYKDITRVPDAAQWWNGFVIQYETGREMKDMRPRVRIQVPLGKEGEGFPACMQDILTGGPKPGSKGRNGVLMPMAAYFRDTGWDKKETEKRLDTWTIDHYGTDIAHLRERKANARSVVQSVWAATNTYAFSCKTMLSNHGTGAENKIDCPGQDECPWVKNPHDQVPAEIPQLHLSEATKGIYIGTKVQIPVHVSGLGKATFGLPIKIKSHCIPDEKGNYCPGCPNAKTEGEQQFMLSAQDRDILALVDVNDARRKQVLKAHIGSPPKCMRCWFEVIERGNVDEVQLIPMVDYAHAYQSNQSSGAADDNPTLLRNRHVVRRGFYVGHGIQANMKYVVDAYPYEHPEDQSVVFSFEKIESAQNDIDEFRMTPELHERLKIFQPNKLANGQYDVEGKLMEIHRDFEENVHNIRGRVDLSIAVSLCYHSVIGFKFDQQVINKGWWELLVVGDSGTGKSTLVQRLMTHYGLGELLASEEAKRTGLVFSSQQIGTQWVIVWGKIPQNDRRLLVLDEFHSLQGEEVGKLTQLRSEGKARGQGVSTNYETWARTRLIMLANPKHGSSLKSLGAFGVEAVREMFDEHQDLRRTDLAMCVRTDDVDVRVLNKAFVSKTEHRYTSDLCQKLVLWAWSRDPQHIAFAEGAEARVLWWAEVIGATYNCDIYLADRSDMRLKLARIACSVAAQVFSTDAEGKKVVVYVEHVDYAGRFMDMLYRKPSMSFFEYARAYQMENTFSEEKKQHLRDEIPRFDSWETLVNKLMHTRLFSKQELCDSCGYESKDFQPIWKFLIRNQLLTKKIRGYTKTPAFTEFLKTLPTNATGYSPQPPQQPTPVHEEQVEMEDHGFVVPPEED